MSADNGIYIADFPIDGNEGREYRVAHTQDIDAVDYGTPEEQDAFRWLHFEESKSFPTQEAAYQYALQLEKELAGEEDESGCYPFFLEYGICFLSPFDRPLVPMTKQQMKKILGY